MPGYARFEVDERQFVRLIASYLRDKACYEALLALLIETNTSIHEDISEQGLFLQRIVLQGRWDDVTRFLKPILERFPNPTTGVQIAFVVAKQRLLETLSWQGGGAERLVQPPWRPSHTATATHEREEQIALSEITAQLQELRPLCTVSEFNSLCQFLSLERLTDHPEYAHWTVAEGRWQTLSLLQSLLSVSLSLTGFGPAPSLSPQRDRETDRMKEKDVLPRLVSLALDSYFNEMRFSAQAQTQNILTQRDGSVRVRSLTQTVTDLSLAQAGAPPPLLFQPTVRTLANTQTHTQRSAAVAHTTVAPPSPPHSARTQLPTQSAPRETEREVPLYRSHERSDLSVETTQHSHTPRTVVTQSSQPSHRSQTPRTQQKAAVSWTVEVPPAGNGIKRETDRDAPMQRDRERDSERERERERERAPAPAPWKRRESSHSNERPPVGERDRARETPRDREKNVYDSKESESLSLADERGLRRERPAPMYSDRERDRDMESESERRRFTERERDIERQRERDRERERVEKEREEEMKRERDREREADREREREAELERERVRAREKERERQRQLAMEQEREREKEKERERERARERELEEERLREQEREREQQKLREKEREKEKEREREKETYSARGPPSRSLSFQGFLLQHMSSPLRSVSVLSGDTHTDGDLLLAIGGTNAKSIQVLRVNHHLLGAKTPRGARDREGEREGVKDYTSSVSLERTLDNVHTGSVYSSDYHSGSQTLASGSNDKTIRVCRPFRGEVGPALKGHNGTIRVVKFSPRRGGEGLLGSAGAGDFKPRLWDVSAGSCARVFTAHTAAVHALTWLDEQCFVTGCEAGELIAHDVRSPNAMWVLSLEESLRSFHRNPSRTFSRPVYALSARGYSMAIGSSEGAVMLFDERERCVMFDEALHRDDVRSLSLQGELPTELYTASYDSAVAVWSCVRERERGEVLCSNLRTLRGHADKALNVVALADSGDILSSGADGQLIFWRRNL